MEFKMKKLIAGGVAAVLALGLSAAIVAPANAAPYWWYHHHYHGGYWGGPGPAIGAGILGFAAGAAIAGAAANARAADDDHIQACLDAYRSYDPRTDTYLGYDGYRHRCML
jgi:hypothetical protein